MAERAVRLDPHVLGQFDGARQVECRTIAGNACARHAAQPSAKARPCKRCDGTGKRWNNAADEITDCGACKARVAGVIARTQASWPWPPAWWKPRDRCRNVVRAGTHILADIEPIDRAAIVKGEGRGQS